MFCKNCGAEISKDDLFCTSCGTKIELNSEEKETQETVIDGDATESTVHEAPMSDITEDNGPWKVFAIVGFVLGIASLAFCWAFYAGLILSVPGLVFSILGLNSKTKRQFAEKGKLLSIIGIIVGALFTVLFIILIACSVISATAR